MWERSLSPIVEAKPDQNSLGGVMKTEVLIFQLFPLLNSSLNGKIYALDAVCF